MNVRYTERGLSNGWLLLAPVATGLVLATQWIFLSRFQDPWLWVLIGAIVQVFVWLQVAGARTHISMELTDDSLRCGQERIPVAEIAEILPGKAPDHGARKTQAASSEEPEWMTARVMGRLARVPRRRYGIGLGLRDGSTVQAWARDDYALRRALAPLLQ